MSKDLLYLVTDTPRGYQPPAGEGVVVYTFQAYNSRCEAVDTPRQLTADAVELLCCLFDVAVIAASSRRGRSELTDVISDEHFEDDERLATDTATWRANAR